MKQYHRLSRAFQKPNIQYRNLMDAHGESLLREEESIEIYSIVKLQRLSEKMLEFFTRETVSSRADFNEDEIHIQMFLAELQDWQRSTSDFFRNIRGSSPSQFKTRC
jgi:hypothetical protein